MHYSTTHASPAELHPSLHRLRVQVISTRDIAQSTAPIRSARSAAVTHPAHLTPLSSSASRRNVQSLARSCARIGEVSTRHAHSCTGVAALVLQQLLMLSPVAFSSIQAAHRGVNQPWRFTRRAARSLSPLPLLALWPCHSRVAINLSRSLACLRHHYCVFILLSCIHYHSPLSPLLHSCTLALSHPFMYDVCMYVCVMYVLYK
jgi:hypothetical protein